ncbi:MAG TPA: hypothetical protein VIF65_03240 [Methyloceanibacter sp.]
MAQPTAAPSDGTLTFNADGTFSTSKVDSKAEVTVPGTSTRATGQMKCASERDVVGGGRHAYAVHELRRLEGQHRDRGARGHACAGATLSTTQTMPKNTTINTTRACPDR